MKDVHLQKLIHLEDREFLEEEYKVFWRYCVLLELGNEILKNKTSQNIFKKSLDIFNKNIRKLKKFIHVRKLVIAIQKLFDNIS